MKKIIIVIGLLAIAIAGLFSVAKAPAQGGQNRQPHAVIILGDEDSREPNTPFYIQTGLQVQWADSSPSAPQVQKGASLSAVIAELMDQGFTHEIIGARKHLFKR